MKGKVLFLVLYIFISFLTNVSIAQPAELDDHIILPGVRYNQVGFSHEGAFGVEGAEVINNYDGNLMYKLDLSEFLQNDLDLNVSIVYNTNVGHRVFKNDWQFKNEGYPVNFPEWIIGVNGIAVQTLNFENNFYLDNSASSSDEPANFAGSPAHPLYGEEIPLLISGYHFCNKLKIYDTALKKGREAYDYIQFLNSDGSVTLLSNQNLSSYVMNPDREGIYIVPGKRSNAYALVKLRTGNYRNIWYKPGDGLTYYFEEEDVDYGDYHSPHTGEELFKPRIMYLKKIISSSGAYLEFDYRDDDIRDNFNQPYGRKLLKYVYYYPYKDATYMSTVVSLNYTFTNNDVSKCIVYCGNQSRTLELINNTGSGLNSTDRTLSNNQLKIKYVDKIIDPLGNVTNFYYNNFGVGEGNSSRTYTHRGPGEIGYENGFEFITNALLITKIDYPDNKSTSFTYYNKPFIQINEDFLKIEYPAYSYNSSRNFYSTYRDNNASYIIKSKNIEENSNTIYSETYNYSFNGSEYSSEKRNCQVTKIITEITKSSFKGSSTYSPNSIYEKYTYSKFNVMEYYGLFEADGRATNFDSIIKLIEKYNKNNEIGGEAFKHEIYTYDFDSAGGASYCYGGEHVLTEMFSEERSENFNNNTSRKTTTYGYEYFIQTLDHGEKKIIKKRSVIEKDGYTKATQYETEFMQISGTEENNYYNTNKISEEKIYNGSLDKSLVNYYYYVESDLEGAGKLKQTKFTRLDDIVQNKFIDYKYYTENNYYKGFIKQKIFNNGLNVNYTYITRNESGFEFTFEPGNYVVLQNGTKDNLDLSINFSSIIYAHLPLRIDKVVGTDNPTLTSYQTFYFDTDKFIELHVDENGYYSRIEYDKLKRLKAKYIPGSFTFSEGLIPGDPIIELNYDDPDREITETYKNRIGTTALETHTKKKTFSLHGDLERVSIDGSTNYKVWNEFNGFGKKHTFKDPVLRETKYKTDYKGRILEYIYENGQAIKEIQFNFIGADNQDMIVKEFDEEGNKKENTFDIRGNLVKTKLLTNNPDENDLVTNYSDNSIDQILEVTSPKGIRTTYTYDGWGNVNSKSNPDIGSYNYTYDEYGNLRTQTHSSGEQITHEYDALNRLTITRLNNHNVLQNIYDHYDPQIFLPLGAPADFNPTNLKGRLVATLYRDNESADWNYKLYSYDHLGRIVDQRVFE